MNADLTGTYKACCWILKKKKTLYISLKDEDSHSKINYF